MTVVDIYQEGARAGWNVSDGTSLPANQVFETDVVVIGTGAGGGTTAEALSAAGLSVVMVEEGPLHSLPDFKMLEREAYPKLYQEGMSRTTADGSISVLQGRTVGGSTTVNWTSSFRTPNPTLEYWTELGLQGFRPSEMTPWFQEREHYLGISPWEVSPNENNAILKRGCDALGWSYGTMSRNVRNCWNIGYCGMGCPTNAKQSMLVTTVPAALRNGAHLLYNLRADRIEYQGNEASRLFCQAMDSVTNSPLGRRVEIRARHFVVSGSALGSPALLLRSDTPDPYRRLGKRTFLHPVNAVMAHMPDRVEPWQGAPQSIYSDEFNWRDGSHGEMGFKLEVPPLFPALSASILGQYGSALDASMRMLPHTQATLALLRDGFHEDSPGGIVTLRDDGTPRLDYPLTDYLWRGVKESYLRMAELQFAAGATSVRLVHSLSEDFKSFAAVRQWLENTPLRPLQTRLFTAHQMGGCAMGEDPAHSVVNSQGRHHQVTNLSVIDASTFPTSIGANPQLSIYAMAARQAQQLASELSG